MGNSVIDLLEQLAAAEKTAANIRAELRIMYDALKAALPRQRKPKTAKPTRGRPRNAPKPAAHVGPESLNSSVLDGFKA